MYTDSGKITIAGTNFATSASSNFVELGADAVFSSPTSYVECSRTIETWTPNPSISSSCSLASDDGTWVVMDFDDLNALNAGINFNAVLYSTDDDPTLLQSHISSILCSEGTVSNTSYIADLDWSTSFECTRTNQSSDSDLNIDFIIADDYYFAARTFRISVNASIGSDEIPKGVWYLQGGKTCTTDTYEASCSTWTTLNTMFSSDWTTSSSCDDWYVATSIPEASRDFYEAYRINIPYVFFFFLMSREHVSFVTSFFTFLAFIF